MNESHLAFCAHLSRIESNRVESKRIESNWVESSQIKSNWVNLSRIESNQNVLSGIESNPVEWVNLSRIQSNRNEFSRFESQCAHHVNTISHCTHFAHNLSHCTHYATKYLKMMMMINKVNTMTTIVPIAWSKKSVKKSFTHSIQQLFWQQTYSFQYQFVQKSSRVW